MPDDDIEDSDTKGVTIELYKTLLQEIEESNRLERSRRADQIQILFAIGILGWFVSSYQEWLKTNFGGPQLRGIFIIAATLSLIFLLLKMFQLVFQPKGSLPLIGNIDRSLRIMYVSAVAVVILGIPLGAVTLEILMPITEISLENSQWLVIAIGIGSALASLKWHSQVRNNLKKEVEIQLKMISDIAMGAGGNQAEGYIRVNIPESLTLNPGELGITFDMPAGTDIRIREIPRSMEFNKRTLELTNTQSTDGTYLPFQIVNNTERRFPLQETVKIEKRVGNRTETDTYTI